MTAVAALADVLPAEALEASIDPAQWASLGGVPEAVIHPESAEEAAAVLAWASREGVGVVPAASGRRLGARRMVNRFVVLTSKRLSGLEIYEPADLTFTAKAGSRMSEIDAALRANRQWLPFDPLDVSNRSLGGLVSLAASGPLWMGYGAVRNHVLGATVATGDGRVLRLGGRVVKNVAGFDLLKPIVGGQGTLAFVVSVCMRAFPEPEADRLLVLRADTLAALVEASLAIGTAPVLPVSSVLSVAANGSGAELRVRLHGAPATVDADRKTLEGHVGVRFEVGTPPEIATSADIADPPGGNADTSGGSGESGGGSGTTPVAGVELHATFLPSRLGAAIRALEGLGPARVSIDTYAARAIIEPADFDGASIRAARHAIEHLDGALSVERTPVDADLSELSSRPPPAETMLASRVASVFDPEGVLWRGART